MNANQFKLLDGKSSLFGGLAKKVYVERYRTAERCC